MMIQDGRIEELSDYIYTDEEWKSMIEPSVLESCSEEGREHLSGTDQHSGLLLLGHVLE